MTRLIGLGKHMSTPSKMPCYSFDLSVLLSGCAARCMYGIWGICYAITNFHEMPWNLARAKKLELNQELLESKYFKQVMINELLEDGNLWFRFFSAGDFPDIKAMHKIMNVCESIDINRKKFWIPTSREDILYEYLNTGNKIPENVCIRYSSPTIDDPTMPELPFLKELFEKNGICYSATSIDRSKVTCPASLMKKHGKCGTCRNCWDKTNKLVVYLIHNTTSIKRAKEYIKNKLHFGDGVTVP
jgi:hypothetical protein